MAEPGTEEEAQAVCQVVGCQDPPRYIIQPLVVERLTAKAMMVKDPNLGLCSHHYQELVLELKPLSIKGGGNIPPFRGVQKL